MHAVQSGQLSAFEQQRRGDVRPQHALFDELMRIVAVHGHDFCDLTILAEHDPRLGSIEIHRAIGLACLTKCMVKPVKAC